MNIYPVGFWRRSCVWLAGLSLLGLTACQQTEPEVALFNGKDLSGWREPRGKWLVVKEVKLDGADARKFAFVEGEGVMVNGRNERTSDILSDGFSLITTNMQPYADFARRFVPPMNEQFALFLPEPDAAAAEQGEMPTPKRWFYVQTPKALIPRTVTTAEFRQLKQVLKHQNTEILKKAEAQMPGIHQKINQGIAEDYQVDLDLSVQQMIPFPAHDETDRTLAYSMLIRLTANDEQGLPASHEQSGTITVVHVRGKFLFLYVMAEKAGLAWTRVAAKKWAGAVVAANPSSPAESRSERRATRGLFSFNWLLLMSFIGCAVGGVITLLAFLMRKK